MRAVAIACLISFTTALGAVVAYRMHTEAMAVVVGVLCGVGSSIPVALLVLFAVRQNHRANLPQTPAAMYSAQTYPQQPQIVVLPGGHPPYDQSPFGVSSQVFRDNSRLSTLPYRIEDDDDY